MPDEIQFPDENFFGDEEQTIAAQNAQISDVLKAFKSSKAEEKKTFEENIDSEYWFCMCFHTRAQKEEFLEKLGIAHLGDKYIDGVDAAIELHIPLTPAPPPRAVKVAKRWKGLV